MLSWIRSWWSKPVTVEADPAPQVVLPRSIAFATPIATPIVDDPPTPVLSTSFLGELKGDKKMAKAPKSPRTSKLHETV